MTPAARRALSAVARATVQRDAAEAKLRRTMADAAVAGAPLRAIAATAGTTHPTVAKILRELEP